MKRTNVIAIAAIMLATAAAGQAQAEDYQAVMGRGAKLVKARNYPAALAAFEEAVKADPMQLDGYFNAGNIALHLQKCREVLLYFRGFLYLSPGTPDDKAAKAAIATCEAKPTGILAVRATEPGVEVWISGALVGRTPIGALKLATGTYRVELRHPDFEPFSREVTLAAAEETRLEEPLTRRILYGYLEVKTEPADGVQVYLDEKPIGVTPLKDKLRLETRKFFLRLEKAGYDRWIRNVIIGRERTLTVTATLEPVAPPPADK
jgi:tetratricopeptide (TPR) repeat protein